MRSSHILQFSLVFAVVLAAASCSRQEQAPQPIRTVDIAYSSLPLSADELPPGPGRAETVSNCMSCHSPAYITSQPRFSRAIWESEVKKMVDAYGADVSPADQRAITNYLVSIRGLRKTTP
ncbi:MAG: hypothetical protein LC114_26095 [Bryobacterales bacterium]|nr:hypothetical protein [Bryobacterales bacterium]